MKRFTKKSLFVISAILFSVVLVSAVVMTSLNYLISGPLAVATSGTSSSASFSTNASAGVAATGNASSPSFTATGGSGSQIQTAVVFTTPPSNDLAGVFVYPNPFKPGSGAEFDAAKITFKKLTAVATIKIYSYTGQLIRTLDKTDATLDYFEWDGKNQEGEKIASGVYVYLIKNSAGQMAKGKFAIVR